MSGAAHRPLMGLLEHVPVEAHADAGLVRCDGPTVLSNQRAKSIAVDRKTMNLNPTGIGLGGDKADMEFLHAVAADRNSFCLREASRPQPAADAAAIGGVGLDVGERGMVEG